MKIKIRMNEKDDRNEEDEGGEEAVEVMMKMLMMKTIMDKIMIKMKKRMKMMEIRCLGKKASICSIFRCVHISVTC